jgi:hypothetical protein
MKNTINITEQETELFKIESDLKKIAKFTGSTIGQITKKYEQFKNNQTDKFKSTELIEREINLIDFLSDKIKSNAIKSDKTDFANTLLRYQDRKMKLIKLLSVPAKDKNVGKMEQTVRTKKRLDILKEAQVRLAGAIDGIIVSSELPLAIKTLVELTDKINELNPEKDNITPIGKLKNKMNNEKQSKKPAKKNR